jgi:hypothetical protein
MIYLIDGFLKKKFQLSDDLEVSGYVLLARLALFFITASWIAFYPAYLLLIHMKVEGFFSYDVFTDGLFGIKSFLFLVFILISMSSLYMWGFICVFTYAVLKKSKALYAIGIVLVFFSIVTHIYLFSTGFISGHLSRVMWISLLGFVFSSVISFYIANPLKTFLSNWIGPALGIFITATVPVFQANMASDIVKTGLESFKVGGGMDVSVHRVDNNAEIQKGTLLLLTPSYIYLRSRESGYVSITRTGDTYVVVK